VGWPEPRKRGHGTTTQNVAPLGNRSPFDLCFYRSRIVFSRNPANSAQRTLDTVLRFTPGKSHVVGPHAACNFPGRREAGLRRHRARRQDASLGSSALIPRRGTRPGERWRSFRILVFRQPLTRILRRRKTQTERPAWRPASNSLRRVRLPPPHGHVEPRRRDPLQQRRS